MIEYVVFLITVGFVALFAYHCGLMDGEQREYKKWLARRWHRPGCSCDGDNDDAR